MASPFDLTTGADGYFVSRDYMGTVLRKRLDFSKANGSGASLLTTEVAKLIPIPSGFVLMEVLAEVVTAGTAGSSFQMGDTATAAGFSATDITAASVAGTVFKASGTLLNDPTSATTAAATKSKYYPSGGTFQVTAVTAPATGVFDFTLVGFQK